jgi:hypothetical protein
MAGDCAEVWRTGVRRAVAVVEAVGTCGLWALAVCCSGGEVVCAIACDAAVATGGVGGW